MAKARSALAVSAIDRSGHWLSAHGAPTGRSEARLSAAGGPSDSASARALAINRKTVTLWRARYAAGGLESLWEVAPGRGRKPRYGPERLSRLWRRPRPPRPGCRTGVVGGWRSATGSASRRSATSGAVIQAPLARDLQTLARPPVSRETDVWSGSISIRRNTPGALCHEKSQIQALDRTQPGLPLKKGRCGTMTHDYKRHGTTTLFAALDVLQGKVIGPCYARHRHKSLCDSFAVWITSFPAKRPYTLCWTTMAPTTIPR